MSKSYKLQESLLDDTEVLNGWYDKYEIPDSVVDSLFKRINISRSMYEDLQKISPESSHKILEYVDKSKIENITYLVDEDSVEVLGITTSEDKRFPVLNDRFIKSSLCILETCKEIEVIDKYCVKDDTVSSILIRKKGDVIVDKGGKQVSYTVGALIRNDELDCASCRLVVFLEEQPYYIPTAIYSSTTNRYKKSTSSTEEALEVLVLKVVDDLRDDNLVSKLGDFYIRHSRNKDIFVSYEEYNTILRTMLRIPSVLDDTGLIQGISSKLCEFERKYAHLEEKRSSYVWRCTALSDMTLGSLVSAVSSTLNSIYAPLEEYREIRELIGYYLGTKRIASEIAREDN